MPETYMDAFAKRRRELEEDALRRELATTADATTRRGQDIHAEQIALERDRQRIAAEQFLKTFGLQEQQQQFGQQAAAQEGIAKGLLRPAGPPSIDPSAPEVSIPGIGPIPLGVSRPGANYAGTRLEAVPLLDQLEGRAKLDEQLQTRHRENFIKAYDDFVTAHPDFERDNPGRREELLASKLFGFNPREETLSNLQAAAVRQLTGALASGATDSKDPRIASALNLFKYTAVMTQANHPPPVPSPLQGFQLNAEQQATKLLQAAEAEAQRKFGDAWKTMPPDQQAAQRRSIAQSIATQPNSGFSAEALQRATSSVSHESKPVDPVTEFLRPILEEAARKRQEAAKQSQKK
jgi:hypothetical protein